MGNTDSKIRKTARLLRGRRPQQRQRQPPPPPQQQQQQQQQQPAPIPLQQLQLAPAALAPVSWEALVAPEGALIVAGTGRAPATTAPHPRSSSPSVSLPPPPPSSPPPPFLVSPPQPPAPSSSIGASSRFSRRSITPPLPTPPPPTPPPPTPPPPFTAVDASTTAAPAAPAAATTSPLVPQLSSPWASTPTTTTSSGLQTPPDVPFNRDLPQNWRQYIAEVVSSQNHHVAGNAARFFTHRYMRVDGYGNSVSPPEILRLRDVVYHERVLACPFPLFTTLFADGSWTTRFRRVTFLIGAGVRDWRGVVGRVAGVRFWAGREEVHVLPLDGRAFSAGNALVGLGVEWEMEMEFDAVFGVEGGASAGAGGIVVGEDINDEGWCSVDDLVPCLLP